MKEVNSCHDELLVIIGDGARRVTPHLDPMFDIPAKSINTHTDCSAASLAIYIRTGFPTLPCGDAGELVTTAHVLGVGHPPVFSSH